MRIVIESPVGEILPVSSLTDKALLGSGVDPDSLVNNTRMEAFHSLKSLRPLSCDSLALAEEEEEEEEWGIVKTIRHEVANFNWNVFYRAVFWSIVADGAAWVIVSILFI